ncbi:hypothetical protein [Aquabacterium sp. OR-4]|uniref:hypothetical protein n=1 Tax=Aquabacterium sp. OR-4 TaxID=2978127 RepID=UPI0021B1E7B7|nr:hypothetical protein [Aquabacterium sp. OR-4]MDT7837389.1 hypothetical protein [Aquabacterium sp. OR-4]
MRLLLRGLLVGLIALPLLALAALWLALQAQPMVPAGPRLGHADIERARALLRRHDPRRTPAGVQRAVALTARDIELLIDQASQRLGPAGQARAQVTLLPGTARVRASLALPSNPLGGWLNVDLTLAETQALPEVQALRLGALPVPGWLAERALPRLLEALGLQAQGDLAQRIVSRVQFTGQFGVVAFAWPAHLRETLAASLLQPDEQERLRMYVERLAAVAPAGQSSRRVALAALLPPLFALARQRTDSGQSAEQENRAALLALTLVATHPRALAELVPSSRQWARVRPMVVVLHGRSDTPLHYLVSAVLAAEGGGRLADAIGLYKEVSDSRGGSGFSFNDLTADRAGTRLGQRARRDAQALQQRLAAPLGDRDLLPDVSDLPENLPEPEFQRRFGGVDAPAYRAMLAGIEQRLNRLPLLQATP